MALSEAFTVLAVFEAMDKMSGPLEKMNGVLDQFSETTLKAAEAATEAGAKIDESLLRTASGADAVELADARLQVAQSRLTQATNEQAAAEQELLDIQARAAAGLEDEVAATDQMSAAADALTAAQKRTADAAKAVTDAQRLQADTARAAAAANTTSAAETDAAAAAQTELGAASGEAAAGSGLMSKALGMGALAVAAIGYESIKAAGNWQSLTEHLVTDAGESQKNLAMVSAGMLKLAADTGTSTTDVANGMYHVESAGYHGAQALKVMQAAAEGAKVGGADLDTVSKALTGTMNAYSMSGNQATSMMDQLVATVGSGDMRMQDLASSLGNVAPVAAAAGISFAQIGGAIATMTSQNMSAQQATQDLAHTIGSLQNPNAVAVKEMQALGLNVNSVSKNIGKVGLTGTLDELTAAVARNTQGGDVLISTFNQSKQASANADAMIKAMPGSLQSLAKAYLDGSVTQKQWTTDLQGMAPIQANMMKQFAGVADQTHKFNSLLTSGSPAAQTYNAAMSKLLGGTTGLKTALMLTGGRAETFAGNVKTIGDAARNTSGHVTNWGTIQQTFNQKMDRAKSSVEAAGIGIGQLLLPAVSQIAGVVADVVSQIANFIDTHEKLLTTILKTVGPALLAVGAFLAVKKAIGVVTDTFKAMKLVMDANPWLLLAMAVILITTLIIEHWSTIKKYLVDAWHWISSTAQDVWNDIAKFFEGLWKDIEDAAKTAWDAVTGVFTGAFHLITGAVTTVVDFIKNHWQLLLAILTGPIGMAVLLVTRYWKDIETAFEDSVRAVLNVVAWLARIPGEVFGWLMDMAGKVGRALDNAVNWFAQFPGRVWAFLSQMGSDAVNIGKNVMIGLWNGLVSMGSWLASQVTSLIKDVIPGPIQKVLGIFSPSRWAHWAGQMVGHGLSNGITSTQDKVSQATTALAQSITKGGLGQIQVAAGHLTGALTASVTAPVLSAVGAGIPALGGASGGVQITNQFDLRGAVVSGSAAMNQLAEKVGVALARKLPAAGVKTRTI